MTADTLDTVRARINEITDELDDQARAFASREDVVARIDGYIAATAENFSPDVTGLVRRARGSVTFSLSVPGHAGDLEPARIDFAPILAAIDPAGFKDYLLRHTEEATGGQWGLPEAKQRELVAALTAERALLERREELLVRKIEDAGESVERRTDLTDAIIPALTDDALKRSLVGTTEKVAA